jgi:hypothetical protein
MTVKKKEKDRQKEIKERETYVKNEKRKEKERATEISVRTCVWMGGVWVLQMWGRMGSSCPLMHPLHLRVLPSTRFFLCLL